MPQERTIKNREYNRQYYIKNAEKIKAYSRAYHYAHVEKVKDIQQRWYKHNKELVKEKCLQRRYGMELEHWNALYAAQEGKCAICKRLNMELCVDHSHNTGKIRALLCHRCNRSLGGFNDSVELLQVAINYLQKYANQ